jgi:vitamin B12 transporter
MRRVCLLCGLVGILGGAIPAHSQNPPIYHEDVVVTASLEAAAASQAPATVTVLTEQEIAARQATTVLELLGTAPGVTAIQSGSPGSVTSVFTRGTNSTHTLALWNGIPLNDPFFGAYDWAFLPTDGAARVEVARGPLSILYGSDAVGGAVNVITDRQGETRFRLEGGEDRYGRASLTTGHDFGVGGTTHFDGIAVGRTGEGPLPNDFYDGWDATARLTHQVTPQLQLGLVARLQDAEVGIPRSGATLTPNRRQEQTESELALPLSAHLGERWGVEALLSRTAGDFTFQDPDAFFSLNDTETKRLRARVVATRELAGAPAGGWLAFGGEWHREEVSNLSTFGINLNRAHQRTGAAFAQFHRVWNTVSLTVGARGDDNDAFGSEVSPHAALLWQLPRGHRLRVSYGEAFRAPSLGELFFPFSGNPDLQAEQSTSYEMAWEGEVGPWRWQLAAFHIRQRELITFDPATFANINLGRAASEGVEAEVGYLRGPWRLRVNATLLNAEDRDTGAGLLRRPEESGNVIVTYAPGRWNFNLVARYVGERPDFDPVTFGTTQNGSYTRFDVAVGWQRPGVLRPYARIANLADTAYDEALGFPAPGRTLVGGVTLRFGK